MKSTTNQKHPSGGSLRGSAAPNGLAIDVWDTRRLDGRRRSVRAVVFDRGVAGYSVVVNPGPDSVDAGLFVAANAWSAYERFVSERPVLAGRCACSRVA